MVLFCFFLGVFTTALYGIYEVLVQRQTIRQLKRNLEILAQELKSASARAGKLRVRPRGPRRDPQANDGQGSPSLQRPG